MSALKYFSCLLLLSFQTSFAQDYYPLQIGNRWDYLHTTFDPWTLEIDTSYYSVEVIGDSLFPNSQTYFVLSNYDLTQGKYVRNDSRFIFYFDDWELQEDTLYRLGAEVGESWELFFGSTVHVKLLEKDTIVIFSQISYVNYYELDGLILKYVALSDKFGPIYFYSPGEPPGTLFTDYTLMGCIINGIVYGNLVSVEDFTIAPTNFYLSQNYPNPFNPSTKIRFVIPNDLPADRQGVRNLKDFSSQTPRNDNSMVSLKVYDVLGNEVATLVNEEKQPGTFEVEFDGTGLPSGIYFYKLQKSGYIDTKKMVLLK